MTAREPFIPYGRQEIEAADIAAVTEALRSAWLTTGPKVPEFEAAFAGYCGARHAVAVNSGTAALHAAMRALQVGPGDEVIVPAITFAATSNAAIYEGATPVFADVEADTLLVDAGSVAEKITPRTKAIVAVDYAGQPADYAALRALVGDTAIGIVADACHAPGALYNGRKVGAIADLSTFSFHPVKHLTTCEGGMITTGDGDMAERMRRFRSHGIDGDHRSRHAAGAFAYDMVELGYNYRLPDVQCALGLAQLKRLDGWVARRQDLAARYDRLFEALPHVRPLVTRSGRTNAHHLYVVRLDRPKCRMDRGAAFAHLRGKGIGANVHYGPVYLHTYYRKKFGFAPGLCPVAERVYDAILTLPIYPAMTDADQDRVVAALAEVAR